jgi:ubiquinone/menaquinone biosynthesis C-methylase UbiE
MLDALSDLGRLERLARGSRGLDVGSGLGGTSMYLARRFGHEITGININAKQIGDAERNVRKEGLAHLVKFLCTDAAKLPLADGSVDYATMIEVAFHVEDKAKLFSELYRVLRPGGLFLLVDQERVDALSDHLGIFHFEAFGFYERCCQAIGFKSIAHRDVSDQVANWFRIASFFAKPAFQSALALKAYASGKKDVYRKYQRSARMLYSLLAKEVRDHPGDFPNFPAEISQESFLTYSTWELEQRRSRYQMWVFEK